MKRMTARPSRLRRLLLALVGILTATGTLATLSTPPAQAGAVDFGTGVLTASIYNDSPWKLEFVKYYGEQTVENCSGSSGPTCYSYASHGSGPSVVDVEDDGSFWFRGKQEPPLEFTYNHAITYKGIVAHTGGDTEYLTIAVSGAYITTMGVLPKIYVYRTSTPPPAEWRANQGAPPNLLANPQFGYEHNSPSLYDQRVFWNEERPGVGVPTVVSLGDSTISGEGGRWAGNTNWSGTPQPDDAGSESYWDLPGGESITDCHRSKSALVHIGHPYRTHNLACSGATTYSYEWDYPQGRRFKPGVDHYCGNGTSFLNCAPGQQMGQLTELYRYARTHNVTNIVLAVGANDFDFSGVVRECIKIYERVHLFVGTERCSESGIFKDTISPATRTKVEGDIYDSLKDLVATMTLAGYDKTMYKVTLQNYWSAIPSDQDIRFADSGFDRQISGGCPILYGDATALNDRLLSAINGSVLNVAKRFRGTAGFPAITLMDVSEALLGHRLCEKNAKLIEDILTLGFSGKGTDLVAADQVEWVTEARTIEAAIGPYTFAEGGHANYWGQLAERNCLRQLLAAGYQGGKCVPAGGVNAKGEPNMSLTSYAW